MAFTKPDLNDPRLCFAMGFMSAAHNGQMRKYEKTYYSTHPVRVFYLVNEHVHDIVTLQAALLHDVLEDTPITEEVLSGYFPQSVVLMVKELTNIYTSHAYPGLNRAQRFQRELGRLATISSDAQSIKYCDLIDNTQSIVDNDPEFAKIYIPEKLAIIEALDKGNPQLRQQCIDSLAAAVSKMEKL